MTTNYKRKLAHFEPFSWLGEDAKRYPMANFVEQTNDMAAGIAKVLELIETAEMVRTDPDAYDGELPILDGTDSFILLRFVIAAAHSMHELAEKRINWLNEHGGREARQGTVAARP